MNFKKIFLVISFLAAFGLVFGINIPEAKAVTVAEIRVQIEALLAQISQLQQQLTEIEGEEPAVWCHDFNVNLRYGDSGIEVKALQTALHKEGFAPLPYKQGDKNYGHFEQYTASAVVGFQEKYASDILAPWGLEHGTGYVGLTTRKKLNELYGCEEKCWSDDDCMEEENQFCEFPIGQCKGPGECMVKPDVCAAVVDPVCGCDGKTYSNDCVRRAAGVSKKHDGKCKVEKSITVISPNGGEKWVEGKTYKIKWESNGVDKVNIEYGDGKSWFIVRDYPADAGEYSWTPKGIIEQYEGFVYPEKLNEVNIRILIFDAETSGVSDFSDNYFSIVSAEETCHTSPLWSWDYCSPGCKCYAGEGDCDTDADCYTGYCAHNVGAKYGQVSGMDVCEERLEKVVVKIGGGGTYSAKAGETATINQIYLTNQSSEETAEILHFVIGNETSNNFVNYFERDSYELYTTNGAVVKVASLENTGVLDSTGYLIFDVVPTIKLSPSVGYIYSLRAKVLPFELPQSTIVDLVKVKGLTGTGETPDRGPITSIGYAMGKVNIVIEEENLPDLTITDIWYEQRPFDWSEANFIFAKLCNISSYDLQIENPEVRLEVDGEYAGLFDGSASLLTAGKCEDAHFSTSYPLEIEPGTHSVKAIADPSSKIPELNENNNELIKEVYIEPEVEDIPIFSVSPDSPTGILIPSANMLLAIIDVAAPVEDITWDGAADPDHGDEDDKLYFQVNNMLDGSIDDSLNMMVRDETGYILDTISWPSTRNIKLDFTYKDFVIPAGSTKQLYFYMDTREYTHSGDYVQLWFDDDGYDLNWSINYDNGDYNEVDRIFAGDIYAGRLDSGELGFKDIESQLASISEIISKVMKELQELINK